MQGRGRKEGMLICIIDMVIVKSKYKPGPRKIGRNVGWYVDIVIVKSKDNPGPRKTGMLVDEK